MPEYLAPGVYVEEVSFRSKSIEGVSTSVCAFIGPTLYGPTEGEPELLTSFSDFQRIYGGSYRLRFGTTEAANYMAYAVRAFFDNGGSKLYVQRVYEPPVGSPASDGHAFADIGDSPPLLTLRARFPGAAGNMQVTFTPRFGPNFLRANGVLTGLQDADVVFIKRITGGTFGGTDPAEGFYDVTVTGGTVALASTGGTAVTLSLLTVANYRVYPVTVSVGIRRPGRFEEREDLDGFSFSPRKTTGSLTDYYRAEQVSRLYDLTVPVSIEANPALTGADIAATLLGAQATAISNFLATDTELAIPSPDVRRPAVTATVATFTLAGGSDGLLPPAPRYVGDGSGVRKTGLASLEDLEEVSIVAAPGSTAAADGRVPTTGDLTRGQAIANALISHAERMRYRIAVLDAPPNAALSEVRNYRAEFDSKYAALYYPWVKVLDVLDPAGRAELDVPPSGFACGIYARNDAERGVYKAPANEVVRGALRFEFPINKPQQDIVNPEGINCLRFFEGRGYRVWGARLISSDPEWKYVSDRRYFNYLEHSIDRGTQWAVFEPNGEPLWKNIRQTVEDFLFNEWRTGALMGTKADEAFFVRCDRSTMTQNDLDNGRLICLIGVAIVKPAEFVIFRIGQWTGDRK